MIDVEMNDDIRKYQPKLIGPFTKRQIISIVAGLAYSIPIAILVPTDISNKLFIGAILMIPALICGYATMDGAPFEVVAIRMIYLYFLTPAKRKCKQPNAYYEELRKINKKEEQKKISKMTSAEKKEYQASHSNVRYSNRKEFKIYK